MKHKYFPLVAVAAGVLAGLPVVSNAAAVNPSIREARSGGVLAYTTMRQNYSETGTDATTSGTISGTLDKETGNLHGFTLGGNYQGDHFGINFTMIYQGGDTQYDGHYLVSGKPAHATTKNNLLNYNLALNYGFGFAALPKLALIPGIDVGATIWNRKLPTYSEVYDHGYAMVHLAVDYAITPSFVAEVGYGAGRTYDPQMHSDYNGNTYNLGEKGISSAWADLTWVVNRHFKPFVRYQTTKYKYGASAVASDSTYEPNSSTTHDYLSAGVRLSF